MKRLHAIVEGHVQGVNYRSFVQKHAKELNITGWVCNLSDGAVEVVAEGEDIALEHLILFLGKGPQSARVDDIRENYSHPTGEFVDFKIRY